MDSCSGVAEREAGAPGAKAAAEPTRRVERASFMVAVVIGFDCGRAGGKARRKEAAALARCYCDFVLKVPRDEDRDNQRGE